MFDVSYWTMVGAVGQAIGALATAAAVALALWQSYAQRRIALRLRVTISQIVPGVRGEIEDVLSFDVTNFGDRPVTIQSVGWETGYLRRFGPKWLRKQYAIQLMGHPYSRQVPLTLPPGEKVSLLAPAERFFHLTKTDRFFFRELPYFGLRLTRVRGSVHTPLQTIKARADNSLRKALAESLAAGGAE